LVHTNTLSGFSSMNVFLQISVRCEFYIHGFVHRDYINKIQ